MKIKHFIKRFYKPNFEYAHLDIDRLCDLYYSIDFQDNGCWICHRTPSQAYPNISMGGKNFRLPRVMLYLDGRFGNGDGIAAFWSLSHVSAKRNNFSLHTCHNPRCINPDHLIISSQTDNHKMARDAGRVPTNKITREIANSIKKVLATNKLTGREIADAYDVSESTISEIKLGKSWTDLTPHHIVEDTQKMWASN